MSRNTASGIRYLCGPCALSDPREIVHRFRSDTGGRCRFCRRPIELGEMTYILDSERRREPKRRAAPEERLFDLDLY